MSGQHGRACGAVLKHSATSLPQLVVTPDWVSAPKCSDMSCCKATKNCNLYCIYFPLYLPSCSKGQFLIRFPSWYEQAQPQTVHILCVVKMCCMLSKDHQMPDKKASRSCLLTLCICFNCLFQEIVFCIVQAQVLGEYAYSPKSRVIRLVCGQNSDCFFAFTWVRKSHFI